MSSQVPQSFSYESMGTTWRITLWDTVSERALENIQQEIVRQSEEFDQTYSRFIRTSLVWELAEKTGEATVTRDLTAMLRLYQKFDTLSGGKLNPLVGFSLSDLGYDADYSLEKKPTIRPTPGFQDTVRMLDDEHIEIMEPVLIDIGALGKGYFVDKVTAYLQEKGIARFLVDGSGDIFYQGNGEPIRVGLEHPADKTKVIGVLEMTDGALCGSGSNRRAWAAYHHIIDPQTQTSPTRIIASWAFAHSAVIADGLATSLFLVEPECFHDAFQFEYCLLNPENKVKHSSGFQAELF